MPQPTIKEKKKFLTISIFNVVREVNLVYFNGNRLSAKNSIS